jgi:DNA-directed RNA polymerase subunit E'
MYYRVKLKDHVRVPPEHMDKPMKEAILVMLKDRFDGFISKEFGVVVNVVSVGNIGDGVLVPGDGAPYYDTEFELIAFRPEMQEVILGRVRDMADFGAFLDDFVSFSKDKVLTGRDSARSLKIGDDCRARVTAVSFKDPSNPKIGCTMRQSGLGKLEWIYEPAAVEPKKKTGKADKKEESK